MPPATQNLDDLRREIDRIDADIHALIRARVEVVGKVVEAKRAEAGNASIQVVRPGREALVIRELLARHEGPFPRTSLVRLWREMISGMTRIQAEFVVAVHRTDGEFQVWDSARDHFGAGARYTPLARAQQVVTAVRDGAATLGVVPMPRSDDREAWWPILMGGTEMPHIVGRLPFIEAPGLHVPETLVIAGFPPEATGDDASLLALEANDVSISSINRALGNVGFDLRRIVEAPPPARGLYLAEVAGFVGPDDERFHRLTQVAQPTVRHAVALGSYAEPVVLGD